MKKNEYTIHSIDGQIQTIYIAEYKDRLLLLDGGSRSDLRRIERYIASIGRTMEEISLIIVTHLHPDHAGCAPILRKKHGIPIAALETIDNWYAGFMGAVQHTLDTLLAWAMVIKMGQPFRRMWYSRKIHPDIKFKSGDIVPHFPDWEIIHTPGHTSQDIVLYQRNDQTLYAADQTLYVNGKWFLPFPITLPGKMKKTLLDLSKLKIQKLLLAHGGIVEDIPANLFLSLIPQLDPQYVWTWKLIMPLMMLPPDIRKIKKGKDH